MRCCVCSREIRAGNEARKRVEYRLLDGVEVLFGENMPRPLSAASGQLVKAAHAKCYWFKYKRENRGGDAVQGSRPGLADLYAEDEDD